MGGIYKDLPAGLDEFDVIIAGGGTSGCVVASRLSDADPDLSILVVEGGRDNQDNPNITTPLFCLSHLVPGDTDMLYYNGNQEEGLGGRRLVVPSGGVLGGGSSVNLLTYSRAQAVDFDSWGMEGWSSTDLLPYLKKLETYHGPGAPDTHGTDGPLAVTLSEFTAKRSMEGFIKSAEKLGWPEATDIQDLETSNATQRNLRYVGKDGKRQDAATNYLHPRLAEGRQNLHVLIQHQVVRVLFDDKKASGIEIRANPKFAGSDSDSSQNILQTIKARKLVVASCGALGTPLVLERSGVGDPSILGKAGVDVIADVPGVGSEYQDHHLLTWAYYSSLEPHETLDGIFSGRLDVPKLIESNDPMLSWTVADVYSKLRPSDEDAKALGPEFERAWNRDYKTAVSRPLSMITSLNGFPGVPDGSVPTGQYYACSTFTPYPYSRGKIHITSPSLDAPIDFTTGFFADEGNIDIKKSVWAYKTQREIIRRMDIYRGEVASLHPPFSSNSNAATTTERLDGPLSPDVPSIAYTADDDAVLEKWARDKVGTTWHSLGTCKMAPLAEGGVVDANLAVYGVEGLRVADLSVPPNNVGANTANTAFVVGEKAADLFIRELGLV